MLFPSPYGDFVFQRGGQREHDEPHHHVSVPLRGFCFSTSITTVRTCPNSGCFRPLTGILFFNKTTGGTDMEDMNKVSVPLRGFCFSTAAVLRAKRASWTGVSVPLRGFCFSTMARNRCRTCRRQASSFRPLTGILFFNSHNNILLPVASRDIVSVPLRGFCFSTILSVKSNIFRRKVSVPLRGFCFST